MSEIHEFESPKVIDGLIDLALNMMDIQEKFINIAAAKIFSNDQEYIKEISRLMAGTLDQDVMNKILDFPFENHISSNRSDILIAGAVSVYKTRCYLRAGDLPNAIHQIMMSNFYSGGVADFSDGMEEQLMMLSIKGKKANSARVKKYNKIKRDLHLYWQENITRTLKPSAAARLLERSDIYLTSDTKPVKRMLAEYIREWQEEPKAENRQT